MKKILIPLLLSVVSCSAFADTYVSSIDIYKKDAQGKENLVYNTQNVIINGEKSYSYFIKSDANKYSPEGTTEGLHYSSNVYKDKDNADISVFSFDLNFNFKDNTAAGDPEEALKTSKFAVSQKLLISDDYSKDLSFPPYVLKIKVKKV